MLAYSNAIPLNQYSYILQRNSIKSYEHYRDGLDLLNSKEKVVDSYLRYLKAKEFNETKNNFYASRPIEKELANVTQRLLYKHLKKIPKGGNLHLHEDQVLDREIFLNAIINSPFYDLLHICDQSSCNNTMYFLDYFINSAPTGWTKVKTSNWTVPEIVRKTTLFGLLNDAKDLPYATDSGARWAFTEQTGVFLFYQSLYNHNDTRLMYLEAYFDLCLRENVQLIEFRTFNFGSMWYFDKNGQKAQYTPQQEASILNAFRDRYKAKNPKFIDFVYIIQSIRKWNREQIKADIEKTFVMNREFPDLVRGYDMVAEEDLGHTLLYHSSNLIDFYNQKEPIEQSLQFFFHAGETNWPEDFNPSLFGDDVTTIENIYDAVLLKTKRIGHGLGFIKHPALYRILRENDIAIEICPTSNQLLGYVPDLRNHPGVNYYRSGVPVVIASDDPGSFGYNELTVDYYMIYMAWGLNLFDIKTLARNAIEHSSIYESRKESAIMKWQMEWDKYVASTYELVCMKSMEAPIVVADVLPTFGPSYISSNISVYGYGFEATLCKEILCIFGEYSSPGELRGIGEIQCRTPSVKSINSNLTVNVGLWVDGKIIETSFNYTFVSSVENHRSVQHSYAYGFLRQMVVKLNPYSYF